MSDGTSQEPPYGTEYAKSNRSSCKGCKEPIPKDTLRMSVRTPSRHFDGLQDNWFHFECFWKRAKAENLSEGNVKNLENLKWDDQEKVRKRIIEAKENATEAPTPKSHIPKAEVAKSGSGKCFECKEKILKGDLRIQLKASNFHPACLKKLNALTGGVETIVGYDGLDEDNKKVLDELFGKPKRKGDDVGSGDASATPRKKAKKDEGDDEKLMARLKKQSEVLWQVRKDLADHLTREEIDTILQANGRYRRKRDGPDVTIEHLADCIVFGVPEHCPECDSVLFYTSAQHTYKCYGYISEYTQCSFSTRTPKRVEMRFPKTVMQSNEWLKGHTFPGLAKRRYAPGSETITPADTPKPLDNIKKRKVTESETKSSKPAYIKNGVSIDGNCEVAEFAHVFVDTKKVVWQAALGHTDIARNRNSYYKIQLLKHDHDEKYYVFRSWGRIGTDQGGYKTEHFDDDLSAAKKNFEFLFKDKTKNEWSQRDSFQKHPGMMDMIDLEVDKTSALKKFDVENSKSKLARPIKEVIATIFDINVINDTLKQMDLDMEKLPLGKLSRSHIMSAYRVLKELDAMFTEGAASSGILDASNRFYTLIPHASGRQAPPLLNNIELVREKTKLLDDLLEIEVAYSLIKQEDADEAASDHQIDSIDAHYKRLNCELEVLDQKSVEFLLIKDFVAKTHAPTHSGYKLKVKDVFTVNRDGEASAFKRDIGNVHLLWHGSRTSNYAGILSQGLRIAPPEAPANGYMFGKGIYFADMVSKSANYCYANNNDDGFLMLCEVALGEVQPEKTANEGLKKPKKGKHSVKGVGQIHPDESTKQVLPDGTIVPIGKPKKTHQSGLSLQYNEYIVYDEAQVRIKYLIRATFVPSYND